MVNRKKRAKPASNSVWTDRCIPNDAVGHWMKARWEVANLDNAVGWFQRVLCFSVHDQLTTYAPVQRRVARLWLPELWIELIEWSDGRSALRSHQTYTISDSSFHLPIVVTDIDVWISRAQHAGWCDVIGPLIDYQDCVKFCYLQTDESHSIKLIQALSVRAS